MQKILECVPNFSEGRDPEVIRQITSRIEEVEGVRLLGVDPGKGTNRTVVTFVGAPEPVVEAAFRAVQAASEEIDMSRHHGEHPRFGATDVCPLVPVSGITMEEATMYARRLAERIGLEIGIPVYCYENAAYVEERRNLAHVRSGEYEGLKEKLARPEWKPDFGPAEFNSKTGAVAVGARDFLVAYNVNLNTSSTRRANAIAFDVRERGRVKRKGHPLTGEIVRDREGNPVMIPGTLKAVKAIGWYIEEYGMAQISMNLTNISVTPVHVAFDEVCRSAEKRGVRVTGSELVGLVPLRAMLEAGKHFLRKQKRSLGIPDRELIRIAVKSMGLDELGPFVPGEKIIEYRIADEQWKRLSDKPFRELVEEIASESPAPGGGSASACMGAMGISLASMVANLSAHKRGWDDRWEEFSGWAEKGKEIQVELLELVEEDTRAFNAILEAFRLPANTPQEVKTRKSAIQAATIRAIEVPYRIMNTAFRGYELAGAMVHTGNPGSITDAGVGALALHASIEGAWFNVLTNAPGLEGNARIKQILKEGKELVIRSDQECQQIRRLVLSSQEKQAPGE